MFESLNTSWKARARVCLSLWVGVCAQRTCAVKWQDLICVGSHMVTEEGFFHAVLWWRLIYPLKNSCQITLWLTCVFKGIVADWADMALRDLWMDGVMRDHPVDMHSDRMMRVHCLTYCSNMCFYLRIVCVCLSAGLNSSSSISCRTSSLWTQCSQQCLFGVHAGFWVWEELTL